MSRERLESAEGGPAAPKTRNVIRERMMTTIRRFNTLVVGLVFVAVFAAVAQAEDFSVHIKDLAEVDAKRPMPVYRVDRVLTRSGGTDDMPEKIFDVFIRFKVFGDVRLDEACQAGPSTGKLWTKGMKFSSGLADLGSIKTAWIKGSPSLFIVAWVDEPDGRGISTMYRHRYVILQLQDR